MVSALQGRGCAQIVVPRRHRCDLTQGARVARLCAEPQPQVISHLAKELVGLIVNPTGFRGQIRWDTAKPSGQLGRRLDTRRARALFGFQAHTKFREGLRRTIQWYRKASR